MAANVRELLIGFGRRRQKNIDTANSAAGVWRLNRVNAAFLNPTFIAEDDATELGKGHEFATTTYKSHITVGPHTVEKYLSSQIMAWAGVFGLGSFTFSAGTYTCTPLNPVTAGLELPYFSWIEQIRPGADRVHDIMAVGCALQSFNVSVQSGPGRASSRITFDIVGTGKLVEPSGITLPAKTAETELPGASLALTVLGVNYVTLRRILSLEWGWTNNIREDAGFYPGSGTQDGYAIKGRLFIGDRAAHLRFVALLHKDSDEYSKLKALTTGTAVISQTFSSTETYTATFHQVGFRTAEIGESDGLLTVSVECSPQFHATNGILTLVAKTGVTGIGEAEP